MLRFLKQIVLTTVLAVLASQASAMFVQPDWFDPTQPGVGTNRYAYSFNDPINLMDQNGNQAGPGMGALAALAVDDEGNVDMEELDDILDEFNQGLMDFLIPDFSVFVDGKTDINDLIEAIGIAPSTKIAKALDPIFDTMRSAGRSNDEIVDIFRAVSDGELEDIASFGGFRAAPGGASLSVKQFANDLAELQKFSKHFPDLTRTVKVQIPKDVLEQFADRTPVDPMIFKSGTVTIPENMLDDFNAAIRSITEVAK